MCLWGMFECWRSIVEGLSIVRLEWDVRAVLGD